MGALNGVVNVHRVVYGRPEMGDCIILRGTTLMSPLWTDHHDRYSDDWAHGPFGLMSSLFLFLPMMRTAQRLNSRNHCGILGLTFGMDAWNGHVGRATLGYSRGLIFNTVPNSFQPVNRDCLDSRLFLSRAFNDTFWAQA